MSSLFAALGTASNALGVFEQAIGVIQNNVANSTTPGYVTQSLQLAARPFDATQDVWGGVESTGVQSSRDAYAERSVRAAQEQAGFDSQQANSLGLLQQIFDVSGTSGIPGGLSALYSAFSAWSANPTDATARQQVLTAAQSLTQAFSQTYSQAQQISANTDTQIQSAVGQVNQYAGQIAALNKQIRNSSGHQDGGLQAQLYNTLEQLSNVAPVDVHIESDGTATVLLGGQSPLVTGATQNAISLNYVSPASAANPGAPPSAQLLSADGHDITSLVTQGTLGGALQFRNTTIPQLIGDGQQQGTLNQLAQGVADRVNTILSNGQVSAGPPAVPGVPLFTYAAGAPTQIASSLALTANITPAQLAAIDPGPPAIANGTASNLAALADPKNAADRLNGLSYTRFYAGIASSVGQQAADATAGNASQTQLLNQAQNLRAQVSGVSLNDQAAKLLEFQQAYQASSQIITVIKSLNDTLLQVLQSAGL